MYSKIALALSVFVLTSCGLFGSKTDPDSTLDFPQTYGGCFNEAGVRFERYLKGEIAAKDWNQAWDCTTDSLKLLNKFAGRATGFRVSDLESLVTTLVLTDTELPKTFMPAAFKLKASLIGGSTETLTAEELEKIIAVFQTIKRESAAFIPQLVTKRNNPSPEKMLVFSSELSRLITTVGAEFSPGNASPLSRETIETLIKDLTTVFKWESPDYLIDAAMAGKAILTGGSPDEVEANSWARVFQTLGSVGAPLIAIISVDKTLGTAPNEYGEFLGKLGSDIEATLEESVEVHGGQIPAHEIDALLDSLPDDTLPVTKTTAKDLLRVATGKILGAAQAGALDKRSLQRALALFNRWKRGKTHLERLYAVTPINRGGVGKNELLNAASNYRATLDAADRPDLDRLVGLVNKYRPMFAQGDEEMLLGVPITTYSFDHMVKMHWIDLVSEITVSTFSTSFDRAKLSLADFRMLYNDAYDFGVELNVIDPTVPDFDGRRFREADFYMPVSDGNGFIVQTEAAYYIASLSSAASLYKRIRENIEEPCKISDSLGPMEWKWMDPNCVRQRFFSNLSNYWGHAPELLAHYNRQNLVMRTQLERDFEGVARLNGFTSQPFGGYDIKAFASAMHYVESIFYRYDADGSQWFNTSETIAASAVFGNAIADAAGIDRNDTAKIEAIFTFIMKNGRKPADGLGGTIEVGAWLLVRPFWDLHIDRNGVYKAFSALVAQ